MLKLSPKFLNFSQESIAKYDLKDYFIEIIKVLQHDFDPAIFSSILTTNNILNVEDIKLEALDFLISYANFILKDNVITDEENHDFSFLKKIFKIKEGDFKEYKNFQINEILKNEFIKIYADNFVDQVEQTLNLNLQSLFDLSYDEFETIKKDEILIALSQGADPRDLDIAAIPKEFKNIDFK